MTLAEVFRRHGLAYLPATSCRWPGRRRVHVHALIAVGALTPTEEWQSPRRGFLFPVRALSRVFRGKFIAALGEARGADQSLAEALTDGQVWRALCQQLLRHDRVVYAKQPLGGPEQVLEYRARYTHRVAISNECLVGMDQTAVRFRVRWRAASWTPWPERS